MFDLIIISQSQPYGKLCKSDLYAVWCTTFAYMLGRGIVSEAAIHPGFLSAGYTKQTPRPENNNRSILQVK